MKKRCLLVFAGLWLATRAAAAPQAFELRYAEQAKADPEALLDESPAGHVLTDATTGRAVSGTADVPPGRYAVRFELSAPPFGRLTTQVDCTLDAPGHAQVRRVLHGPDFPADATPLVVDFETTLTNAATLSVGVEWSGNKETTTNLPTAGAAATEAPEAVSHWELASLQVNGISVERLDRGVAVARVFPDKLLYRPGESGTAAVTLHNFTTAETAVLLQPTIIRELALEERLPAQEVRLAPGATQTASIPFSAGARCYGAEIRVQALLDERVLDENRDYFNVHDNGFTVALGAGGIGIMGMSGYASPDSIARDARTMRATYANWWEKMFWPPDDWGDMTPDRNEWISGQSARWENASNIIAFVKLVKPQGIKSITYGKHCAGGPEGWELVRRHPDWFYMDDDGHPSGSFNTWDLASWHDIQRHVDREGRKQYSSDSWGAMPDFRQPVVLAWGIQELRESSRIFGWDGVRFDGHWTAGNDELSAANMRRLKEELRAFDPHYLFGFNESWSLGRQMSSTAAGMVAGYQHELREAMAGGGMYMQEAIGQNYSYGPGSNERYLSWLAYGTNELQAAEGIRRLGGSYHFIYGSWNLRHVDRLYKFAVGTANGIHPVYGEHIATPGCENWGRFLTRWSAFVWDANLQSAATAAVADVQCDQTLWWRPWVRSRVADAKTRFVIVHLINPPRDDRIDNGDDLMPLPATNITVAFRAPRGETFVQAMLLDPAAAAAATPLTADSTGPDVKVRIPRVSAWSMVVAELNGHFTVPPASPLFTETPDAGKVVQGRAAGGGPASVDPLRPDDKKARGHNEWLYETDTGYNSCPARGIADADAQNGIAQVRDAGERSAYMGRSWLGPFTPGRYMATLRLKLEDAAEIKSPQGFRVTLYKYPSNACVSTDIRFATPEAKLDAGHTLIVDNAYHDYELPFEITLGMPVSMIASADTPTAGSTRLLLDHIVVRQLEGYPDAKLASLTPLPAPAGLVPGGEPGMDVLIVKGWTWDTYATDAALAAVTASNRVKELWSNTGEAIDFPQTHAGLYSNDVVVLVNIGAMGLQFAGRQVLRDFVEAGGGLVLLGGSHTLGQGRMRATYFEDILPIHVDDGRDVLACVTPLALSPNAHASFMTTIPSDAWALKPSVFWQQQTKPKEGATVCVKVGDMPFLVTGTFGKGRVAVVTATALGGSETALPFWKWNVWPPLLARTVQWAAGK